MATFISNRDGNGKTDEKGHYKFQVEVYEGNVLQADSFKVTQFTSPNMSVLIGVGDIRIVYTDYAYTGWNDVEMQISITSPDITNPRIDRVVAYVDRLIVSEEGDTNNPNALKIMVVEGEPFAVPERPTDSAVTEAVGNNPWCDLADILVSVGTTEITDDMITDTRVPIALNRNIELEWDKIQNVDVKANEIDFTTFGLMQGTPVITRSVAMGYSTSATLYRWGPLVMIYMNTVTSSMASLDEGLLGELMPVGFRPAMNGVILSATASAGGATNSRPAWTINSNGQMRLGMANSITSATRLKGSAIWVTNNPFPTT